MGLFDVLTNGALGSMINTIGKQMGGSGGFGGLGGLNGIGGSVGDILSQIGTQAKSTARKISQNTPGGLGGLAGAGALGALLGNVLQGDLMKSVALAGAGAVAWNFYKKWAQNQHPDQNEQSVTSQALHTDAENTQTTGWEQYKKEAAKKPVDPTAELVIRAMIYAARADGSIDELEQNRIDQVLHTMLPNEDVKEVVAVIRQEPIDPNKIAGKVHSKEQGEDVYRLSCAVIDIDHFMEHSYLDALANALNIDQATQKKLENEAEQAKKQLRASIES